ncbi:MAG: hypothetical protein ARM1_0373 [Candidatus Micrarchaeota archaeon]|nr:MAG: hypothetical protein ARM1_0373 [Candidatus Micrarchaeota archaeon]
MVSQDYQNYYKGKSRKVVIALILIALALSYTFSYSFSKLPQRSNNVIDFQSSSSSSSQIDYCPIIYPTSINTASSLNISSLFSILFIEVLAMALIYAFLYAISIAFKLDKLRSYIVDNLPSVYLVVILGFIVLFLVDIVYGVSNPIQSFNNGQYSNNIFTYDEATLSTAMGFSAVSYGISSTIGGFIADIIENANELVGEESVNVGGVFAQLGLRVFNIAINPLVGSGIFVERPEESGGLTLALPSSPVIFNDIILVYFLLYGAGLLLLYIISGAFPILFFIGLPMLIIPPLKHLGSSLIAIFIAFYIGFPALFYLFTNMLGTVAAGSSAALTLDFTNNIATLCNALNSLTSSSTTSSSLSIPLLSQLAQLIGIFGDTLNTIYAFIQALYGITLSTVYNGITPTGLMSIDFLITILPGAYIMTSLVFSIYITLYLVESLGEVLGSSNISVESVFKEVL